MYVSHLWIQCCIKSTNPNSDSVIITRAKINKYLIIWTNLIIVEDKTQGFMVELQDSGGEEG